MREIDAGADYSTQETVGQALDALTADLSREASIAKGRRPFKASTAKGYLSNVEKLREALGGALASTQLRDLTPSLVQEVVDELVETVALTPKGLPKVDAKGKPKRLSASTVKNTLMPLRNIAKEAMRHRVLRFDPFLGVELPRSDEVEREAVTAADAVQFLAVLDDPEKSYWAVAFYAGLRRGEISALRWNDVQPLTIRVDESYCHVSLAMTTPKSRAGRRTAATADRLFPILNAYRETRGDVKDADLVFPATGVDWQGKPAVGTALRGDVMTTRARKAWKAAGLNPVGLHEARHTYASLMAVSGVSLHELSVYMGHSSYELTAKRYAHLYDEQHVRASEKLSAAIDRADTSGRIVQLTE